MANLVYRADFHSHKNPPALERIQVRQKFGAHTLALLDYRVLDKRDYILPPENTAVAMEYGKGPVGVRTGYGYVNHYETVQDDNGALSRMVVLGTSKVMNTMNPMVWSGQSHSGIVREIASRHRMRSVVHSHTLLRESWASGDRTDFQVLKALADEIGFRVWVDGATVWFLDPDKLVRSASSMTTPVIRNTDVINSKVLGGSNIPGLVAATKRQEHYGIDARTRKVFKATSGSPFDQVVMTPGGSDTYHEAQHEAQAVTKRSRDQHVLKANVIGDSGFVPGRLVQFEAGPVNSDQGGLWMVNEANHNISAGEYVTELTCTRGSDPVGLSRLPVSLSVVSANERAVLRNGVTWEAELQERVNG